MFGRYVIAMILAVIIILVAVILGDYGPWYFSWFLGTGFMMLLSVAAGVLFEQQDDAAKGAEQTVPVDETSPAAKVSKG